MRLNLDMNILRHMTDGVLVLDRYAQIIAFNKIGQPWAACCQEMSAALKRLIDEERQGGLVLPIFIDLNGDQRNPSLQRTDAWLCKNGRDEYAIFVVAMNPSAHHEATSQPAPKRTPNLASLMGSEVREQISILRNLIQPKSDRQTAAPGDVAQQCKKVEQLLQEVTDLSQLLEHDGVFAGERLSLTEIVENILVLLPSNSSQATVTLRPSVDPLGPVFGNGAWLSYALRLLIGGLTAGASPSTVVELTTHQMGNFLILTGRKNAAVMEKTPDELARSRTSQPEPVTRPEADLQIMMCKRIIELHAGQLRLTRTQGHPHSPTESFTLTLMTSTPADERHQASCADCRQVSKELSCASDLAQLIASTQTTISDRSLQP